MRDRWLRSFSASVLAAVTLAFGGPTSAAAGDELSDERQTCQEFGTPRPGTVIYLGPSNQGVYCVARRDSKRYGVVGYANTDVATRGAKAICRWYSAGVVRKGATVVVSPERGFHRMVWLARRINGDVVCNG